MWNIIRINSNDEIRSRTFNLYNTIYKKYIDVHINMVGVVYISDNTHFCYEPIDLFNSYNDKMKKIKNINSLQYMLKHIYKNLFGL